MLIFLDTEYTGLAQPNPKLISIALVPLDGRVPFYAELPSGEAWKLADCNAFVLREVLPILKGGETVMPKDVLKAQLLEWLTALPRELQIACDSVTDFRFLAEILGSDWPTKLNREFADLAPLISNSIYDRAVQRFYTVDRPPHNALADAMAYRLGWLAWSAAHSRGA